MRDENTGLAKLPPKYFFRIKKWNLRGSTFTVQLTLRYKLPIGSISTGLTGLADHRACDQSSSSVLWASVELQEELKEFSKSKYEGRKKILGDYPPKRWGVGK